MYNFSDLSPLHDGQVACTVGPSCPMIYRRSVFALVHVYNKLLPSVVEAKTISTFQRRLQMLLKTSATNNDLNWHELYHIVI